MNAEYQMSRVNLKTTFNSCKIKWELNHAQSKQGKVGGQLEPDSGLGLMGQEGTKKRLQQP